LKYTPHLVFHLDDSIERGTRVIEIMQEIESAREKQGVNERDNQILPKSVGSYASIINSRC